MTREELHALVWSKPMRTAAAERGISDVALAKQCRRAGVPVPPRGYWNKLHAGKAVVAQPLPRLSLPPLERAGLGGLFPALKSPSPDDVGGTAKVPPRPEFMDMAEAKKQIEKALEEVKVPARLDRPHPIVAKLLEQEAKRQAARPPGENRYYDLLHLNLATPLQQRRLRILSALLLALARLGITAHGSAHAGESFTLQVGSASTYIVIAVENGPRGDPFFRGRRAGRAQGQRVRLDIVGHSPDRDRPHRTWGDGDTPLERQLTDIVRGILIHVEESTRESALRTHDWVVKENNRKAEEARLAAERAEAERIARDEAAARARLAMLMDGADALERAERIRRYVATVQDRYATRPDIADSTLLDRWAAWALAEADALDPVLTGRVLHEAKLRQQPNLPQDRHLHHPAASE